MSCGSFVLLSGIREKNHRGRKTNNPLSELSVLSALLKSTLKVVTDRRKDPYISSYVLSGHLFAITSFISDLLVLVHRSGLKHHTCLM